MILQDIISKFPSSCSGVIDKNFLNIIGSSPLVPLLKPIREFRAKLVDRSGQYDSLNCGLLSISGIFRGAAFDNQFDFMSQSDDQFNQSPFWGSKTNPFVQVSEEEFNLFVSGLYHSMDSDLSSGCTVVDGSGRVFMISTSLTRSQLEASEDYPTGGGFIRCKVSDDVGEDPYYDLAIVSDSKPGAADNVRTYWISPFIWTYDYDFEWDEDDNPRTIAGAKLLMTSLLSDLVTAVDINSALIQSCDALTSGNRIADFIQLMQLKASEQSATIRAFFSKFAQAYAQGGIKGVIYFILSFAKSTNEVGVGEDGCLKFTDNNAFRPAEYIAGMIGNLIAVITTVVSVIVSIFSRVIAVILQVIGTVAWGIIGSFVGDKNNTYSSMLVAADMDEMLSFLPCSPLALLSGSMEAPLWYKDLYEQGETVIIYDVVGGTLIIGPGSFTESGAVSTINWEFHPSAVKINVNYYAGKHRHFKDFTANVLSRTNPQSSATSIDYASIILKGGREFVEDTWAELMSDEEMVQAWVNDPNTGHLSSSEDLCLLQTQVLYTALFMIWITVGTQKVQQLYRDGVRPIVTCDSVSTAATDADVFMQFAAELMVVTETHLMNSITWTSLVSMAASFQNEHASSITIYNYNYNSDPKWTNLGSIEYGRNPSETLISNFISNRNFFGAFTPVSGDMKFSYLVPQYNGNTFWKWIAVAIGSAIVVSAAIAACSYAWMRFRKSKIASNLVKFNSSQSTYADAMNGVKEEVDPTTGEIRRVSFDVTSDEGQAYIQSCWKDYKTTALSNNIWAGIIGGSKYDVTTFYGEKETSETAQAAARDDGIIAGVTAYDEFDTVQTPETDQNLMIRLITGKEIL